MQVNTYIHVYIHMYILLYTFKDFSFCLMQLLNQRGSPYNRKPTN